MYLKRIRELREDNDLSQKEMGKMLGISQRLYAYYECDERAIPIDILIKIADYYKTSLDYLAERTNQR